MFVNYFKFYSDFLIISVDMSTTLSSLHRPAVRFATRPPPTPISRTLSVYFMNGLIKSSYKLRLFKNSPIPARKMQDQTTPHQGPPRHVPNLCPSAFVLCSLYLDSNPSHSCPKEFHSTQCSKALHWS